jgi:hypothetical protein
MAVYKIFPTQDATIYSAYPNQNTGLDEILDASTNFLTGSVQINGDLPQTSRFLIQFADSDIAYVTQSLIKNRPWDAYLKVFVANSTYLQTNTKILANAVSGSWNMGTGKYMDSPEVQNGVSWIWKTYSGDNAWLTSSYGAGSTGSYSPNNTPGGGVWWIADSASQIFSYRSDLDLNFDVTDIVEYWTGSNPVWDNNGFIVRQDPSQEFVDNINQQITLKYFSVDTHTIYPPCLEFKWKDFSFSTGSLTQITGSNPYVSLANNPGFFYSESIQRFRLNVRPEFPARSFQTSSIYTANYFLPSGSSYWAIKDLDTNEYIVDFDPIYTLISTDASGSFFDVHMNGLQPERYYQILIQSTISGNTIVFDDDYYFKVING